MLAKNANGDAGILNARGALGFFASKLAPTGGGGGQPVRPLAPSQASQLPQLTASLGQYAIPVGAGLARDGDRSASIFAIGVQLPQRHPPLYGAGQNNRGLAEAELRHPINQVF